MHTGREFELDYLLLLDLVPVEETFLGKNDCILAPLNFLRR